YIWVAQPEVEVPDTCEAEHQPRGLAAWCPARPLDTDPGVRRDSMSRHFPGEREVIVPLSAEHRVGVQQHVGVAGEAMAQGVVGRVSMKVACDGGARRFERDRRLAPARIVPQKLVGT